MINKKAISFSISKMRWKRIKR